MLHRGLVAGLLAAFVACTSPTAPASIAGSWSSQWCNPPTPGGCTTLTLTQAGDTIGGTGQWNQDSFQISGHYARPQLSLTMTLGGNSVLVNQYTGRLLSYTEMELTLVGTSETARYYRQ